MEDMVYNIYHIIYGCLRGGVGVPGNQSVGGENYPLGCNQGRIYTPSGIRHIGMRGIFPPQCDRFMWAHMYALSGVYLKRTGHTEVSINSDRRLGQTYGAT